MRIKLLKFIAVLAVTVSGSASAQNTALSYQGRLSDAGLPANGSYDFQFALFDAGTNGTRKGPSLTNALVSVSNGLFAVTLDFGSDVFSESPLWLAISVSRSGSNTFMQLAPRQALSPVPYAITAGNLGAGGLPAGSYSNAVTFSNPANVFNGNYTGDGTGVTNIPASSLSGAGPAAGYDLLSDANGNGSWQIPSWSGTTINARNLFHFWWAVQGTNAIRLMTFSDSVGDPAQGGKIIGFMLALTNFLRSGHSGGVVSDFPWLYYAFANGSTSLAPDTNWWGYHIFLTNGATVKYLAATPNGPAANSTNVWCDTASVYYLTRPGDGTFTVSLATNKGPFQQIATVNANASYGGAVTNFTFPLGYYQLKLTGTSGSLIVIDSGMWNENQRNVAQLFNISPGMDFTNWLAISTNVTAPVFRAWNPTLILLESKDTPNNYKISLPALEGMFTNYAPSAEVIYIGTTPVETNADPTANLVYTIPQNNVMRQFAQQFGRMYWDGYSVFPSYGSATALGFTTGDGAHFNQSGGMLLGGMLWSDVARNLEGIPGLMH